MQTDPLTDAVAQALNDRMDGIYGTVRIKELIDPRRGDTQMDAVYSALDEIENWLRLELEGGDYNEGFALGLKLGKEDASA